MFRDPYDWVEAMRVEPHHSPFHMNWLEPISPNITIEKIMKPMSWHEFVTKPWLPDTDIGRPEGLEKNATCIDKYGPNEIVPCLQEVSDSMAVDERLNPLLIYDEKRY